MTYDLSKLLPADEQKPVYDTVLITLMNTKGVQIQKFSSEEKALEFAKMVIKDWLTMPKTKMEIQDDFNVILEFDGTPAVLVTREYDVLEGNLMILERGLEMWGKK